MGVPFEALIPYAIMLGVRTFLSLDEIQALTYVIDVRHLWSGPFQDPAHAEWREKS